MWMFAEPDVRENLPKFSEWPTFPQLFVKGELGGCDIVLGMFQSANFKHFWRMLKRLRSL